MRRNSVTEKVLFLAFALVACGAPRDRAGIQTDAGTNAGTDGIPDAGRTGTPRALAAEQNLPTAIFADADRVYWTRTSESLDYAGVFTVSRDGGPVTRLAAAFPAEASFDGSHVYFPFNDTLLRVAKAGGQPETLATGQTSAHAVAVNGSALFWARTVAAPQQALMAASKTGADAKQLATSATPIERVISDDAAVYWASATSGECYLGVTSQNTGALQRTDPTTGQTSKVLSGICNTVALAQDATHLYVAAGGQLLRVPKAGGAHEVLESSAPGITAVAVDDTQVYWTYDWRSLDRESKLMARAKAGSGLAKALYESGIPGPLTYNGRSLFWVGRASATVMRLDL